MKKIKIVGIGSGYFAGFQYRAWSRITEVEVSAMCNRNPEKAQAIMDECGIKKHYTNWKEMLEKEAPDVVDIITPPETHLEMCMEAADRGIHIICQKPLAPTLKESNEIVSYTEKKGVRFMVHENWRFQPWYREIKNLLDSGVIGSPHTMYFRSRMGDGWGENAYIPRQPYFREYPRFLVYENGIHFIDTFRYLFGEIEGIYSILRKLNPIIKGEDSAQVYFNFKNGVRAFWDANRYNEPNYENPRLTFGECLLDGENGSIRLYADSTITLKPLGREENVHNYKYRKIEFSGDCVFNTQKHFVDSYISGTEFEPNGNDYLESLKAQEAVYLAGNENKYIELSSMM